MPIRRNPTAVDLTGVKSTLDVETRVLDTALQDISDIKNTLLSRLNGAKTIITYYQQQIDDGVDGLVNTSSMNKIDPNLQTFNKIENFVVLIKDEVSGDFNGESGSITTTGSALILPNTIVPHFNDYFMMKVYDKYNIFRIIEITPTFVEHESGFVVGFTLQTEDVDPNDNTFTDGKIEDTFVFHYNHLGTGYRTLIKSDESVFLEKSLDIISEMTKVYNEYFYNRNINTYFMQYEDLSTVDQLILNETVDPTVTTTRVVGTRDGNPEGVTIYDNNLVLFIKRFKLLNFDSRVRMPSEYIPKDKSYGKSIFMSIEKQDHRRLKNPYLLPLYISRATPMSSHMLYGRAIMTHVISKMEGCLDIMPVGLSTSIQTTATCTVSESTTFTNLVDLLTQFIGVYINVKDPSVRNCYKIFIEKIHETYLGDIEADMSGDNIADIFYLYPLALYVIKWFYKDVSTTEFH